MAKETVRILRFPEYCNPRALLEHGIAMIVRASESDDLRVALEASIWLVGYAQGLLRRAAEEEGNRKEMAELRELWSKASPEEA